MLYRCYYLGQNYFQMKCRNAESMAQFHHALITENYYVLCSKVTKLSVTKSLSSSGKSRRLMRDASQEPFPTSICSASGTAKYFLASSEETSPPEETLQNTNSTHAVSPCVATTRICDVSPSPNAPSVDIASQSLTSDGSSSRPFPISKNGSSAGSNSKKSVGASNVVASGVHRRPCTNVSVKGSTSIFSSSRG
mmetsp:Transcript_29456/g.53429  ORF Transcript_29456/g.53429 Transcript_29456/m.53429 type:complete len:194 (-) Transcript_29456:1261-1842(-)